jgi:queuine tRNA-ribosyltransferase
MALYTLLKQEGHARRAVYQTPHGTIQMPAFMNVATDGAIKGGVSALDLKEVHCQVQLCNTYHLHLRPGDKQVYQLGGLHQFTQWHGPILTDSGGFQVFSLAKLRNIREEGVTFASHIDGHKIFMGPEESMRIQSHLGSTIAMAFDECMQNPAEYDYAKRSVARTTRWLNRCKAEMGRLNSLPETLNKQQLLWGINQGSVYDDLRIEHMKQIAELDLPGYAIGGLAVGESTEIMYHVLEVLDSCMPKDKPRYLMGVGTPANILEGVRRGVDIFDCVMPTRNARHGHAFTMEGIRNLMNAKYELDQHPLEDGCQCPTCQHFTRAYVHHLLKAGEILGMRLMVLHNLYFYNTLMEKIRAALDEGHFDDFYHENIEAVSTRI